jgi:hypothetical protein
LHEKESFLGGKRRDAEAKVRSENSSLCLHGIPAIRKNATFSGKLFVSV